MWGQNIGYASSTEAVIWRHPIASELVAPACLSTRSRRPRSPHSRDGKTTAKAAYRPSVAATLCISSNAVSVGTFPPLITWLAKSAIRTARGDDAFSIQAANNSRCVCFGNPSEAGGEMISYSTQNSAFVEIDRASAMSAAALEASKYGNCSRSYRKMPALDRWYP